MTPFPRISTTTIGQNKNAPRVWLEGLYLLRAGFIPAKNILVEFTREQITITLDDTGNRKVSSKKNGEIPVLDLNSTAISEAFGEINLLQVRVTEGQIVLTPAHSQKLRTTRCRNGREGSIFSGGGLLTEAAKRAGYQPAFAVEINEQYAKVFEDNHAEARMFNLSIEDLPIEDLPPVELLTIGIPCEPFSTARRLDRTTGAKRDKTLPPEAHPLGDLTVWTAIIIRALNPATVVIEEAPGYLNSGAGFMLRIFLERAGYTVEARTIDPRDYGEMTARIRTIIVAHSGSNFQWPQPCANDRTFADIRDDETNIEDLYFTAETKPWLTNHWRNQTAKGNGFTSTQLDDHSTSVPCISKRYMSQQGTGAVVKHRKKTDTWRWLSLAEIRKLHGIPSAYRLADSKTLSGEIIGQGVIVTLFQKIIAATKTLAPALINFTPSTTTDSLYQQANTDQQLGLTFA